MLFIYSFVKHKYLKDLLNLKEKAEDIHNIRYCDLSFTRITSM